MNAADLAERLHALCLMADRHRVPGHRHTAEDYLAQRDELRDGLRRTYRALTGFWPADTAGPAPAAPIARSPKLPVPAALLRHRARERAARTA